MEGVDERTQHNFRGYTMQRSCLVEGGSSFPLIAKAAKIVLATPASEAICERLFKRVNHIGTTDRMARPHDDMFEMLVMAQYNISRHGGVEAMEVNIFLMSLLSL
jgi:hypothetical protein